VRVAMEHMKAHMRAHKRAHRRVEKALGLGVVAQQNIVETGESGETNTGLLVDSAPGAGLQMSGYAVA
jgi:hypothetical protein